ncbi:hypothetical protein MHB63_01685 [Bacillus sp. FSL H8-0547]
MTYSKPIRIIILILSWGSLFLLKPASILRFSPASFLVSLLLAVETMIAGPYQLWTIKGGRKNRLWGDLSFIFGPFISGTLWIFHLTYGRFWRFMLLNAAMDFLLAYPLTYLFEKTGLYKLKKLNKHSLFALSVSYAALNYGYQKILEGSFKKESS